MATDSVAVPGVDPRLAGVELGVHRGLAAASLGMLPVDRQDCALALLLPNDFRVRAAVHSAMVVDASPALREQLERDMGAVALPLDQARATTRTLLGCHYRGRSGAEVKSRLYQQFQVLLNQLLKRKCWPSSEPYLAQDGVRDRLARAWGTLDSWTVSSAAATRYAVLHVGPGLGRDGVRRMRDVDPRKVTAAVDEAARRRVLSRRPAFLALLLVRPRAGISANPSRPLSAHSPDPDPVLAVYLEVETVGPSGEEAPSPPMFRSVVSALKALGVQSAYAGRVAPLPTLSDQ